VKGVRLCMLVFCILAKWWGSLEVSDFLRSGLLLFVWGRGESMHSSYQSTSLPLSGDSVISSVTSSCSC
jgi:hypothetical protein